MGKSQNRHHHHSSVGFFSPFFLRKIENKFHGEAPSSLVKRESSAPAKAAQQMLNVNSVPVGKAEILTPIQQGLKFCDPGRFKRCLSQKAPKLEL